MGCPLQNMLSVASSPPHPSVSAEGGEVMGFEWQLPAAA